MCPTGRGFFVGKKGALPALLKLASSIPIRLCHNFRSLQFARRHMTIIQLDVRWKMLIYLFSRI